MRNSVLVYFLSLFLVFDVYAENKPAVKAGATKSGVTPIARVYDCFTASGASKLFPEASGKMTNEEFCGSKGLFITSSRMIQKLDSSKCKLQSGEFKKNVIVNKNSISYSELEYYCGEENRNQLLKVTCKGNMTTDLQGCLKKSFSFDAWKAEALKSNDSVETEVQSAAAGKAKKARIKDPKEPERLK